MTQEEINRRQNIVRSLYGRGRVVIDWWDGDPIHRAMTHEELAEKYARIMGMKKGSMMMALKLLSDKDYKPTY